jgi:hypothetical protein
MEMDNDVLFPRAKTKNRPGNQNMTRRVSIRMEEGWGSKFQFTGLTNSVHARGLARKILTTKRRQAVFDVWARARRRSLVHAERQDPDPTEPRCFCCCTMLLGSSLHIRLQVGYLATILSYPILSNLIIHSIINIQDG